MSSSIFFPSLSPPDPAPSPSKQTVHPQTGLAPYLQSPLFCVIISRGAEATLFGSSPGGSVTQWFVFEGSGNSIRLLAQNLVRAGQTLPTPPGGPRAPADQPALGTHLQSTPSPAARVYSALHQGPPVLPSTVRN